MTGSVKAPEVWGVDRNTTTIWDITAMNPEVFDSVMPHGISN
jgi:hypothetical protein